METARIYTYSILFSSTEEFRDKTPYLTAILERENGERFASLVSGWKEGVPVAIGQEVRQTGTDEAGNPVFTV